MNNNSMNNLFKKLANDTCMDLVDKGTGSEASIKTLDKIWNHHRNWLKRYKTNPLIKMVRIDREEILTNYELN